MKTKNINIILKKIGDDVVKEWKSSLKAHISTGELYNSVKYKIKDQILIMEINKEAIYVDKGTKPHMPPVVEIIKWIQNKGLSLSPWAVSTNIKKYGTQAHPFLNKYFDVLKRWEKEMIKAGKEDIVELINKQMKTKKLKLTI